MKGAINIGIPEIESDYFCKIDSDDVLLREFSEIYINLFVHLMEQNETNNYHHISIACKYINGTKTNWISRKSIAHNEIPGAYVFEYSKNRLYEQDISGDLLDIFETDVAKKLFRYPYLHTCGHCPTGIMHMFYVLMFRDRKHLYYDRVGLQKNYLEGGISKKWKADLSSNETYCLICAVMELALPNHSRSSTYKSLKTFVRAGLRIVKKAVKQIITGE